MTYSPEHDRFLGRGVPDGHRPSGPVPAAPGITGCRSGKDRQATEARLRQGGFGWRRSCAGPILRGATPRVVLPAFGASPATLARAGRPGCLSGNGSLGSMAIDSPPNRLVRASGEALG